MWWTINKSYGVSEWPGNIIDSLTSRILMMIITLGAHPSVNTYISFNCRASPRRFVIHPFSLAWWSNLVFHYSCIIIMLHLVLSTVRLITENIFSVSWVSTTYSIIRVLYSLLPSVHDINGETYYWWPELIQAPYTKYTQDSLFWAL